MNPFTWLLLFLWIVVILMLRFIMKSYLSKKKTERERRQLEEQRNQISEDEYKRRSTELLSKTESNYIVLLGITLLLLYGLPLTIATYLYIRYYL